jgi:hypothetical protein
MRTQPFLSFAFLLRFRLARSVLVKNSFETIINDNF